jgi:predicted DNA-binding protein (MmcQ/YjbR family)
MNVKQLKAHCARFAGASETLHGHPSNILVYAVADKTFAYFKTSEPEQWRFSFRVTPSRFLELTDMPGVKPARYMGRFHWVTVVKVQEFPSDYLLELLEASYLRAFESLSKAKQRSIAAATACVESAEPVVS